MGNRIDTVSGRANLKIRREPYWNRLSRGLFVGYRKMSERSDGTWLVRQCDETGQEAESRLGALDEFKGNARFDAAVRLARALPVGKGGMSNLKMSVWDACSAYVEWIRDAKGGKAAADLDARYERWILGDPVESIDLKRLTRDHMKAFRARVAATRVKINKHGDTRERSKDTVNRDIASVRAALNHAYANGMVGSDLAWREPLKAFENACKRRRLYLDRDQRRVFIKNAPDDLALFLRGLSILPLRPGALAALTVGDFDPRLNVLNVGLDKTGGDRNIKLPPSIALLFERAIKDKTADAPLLARADGLAWNKDSWKGPLKETAIRAGLPKATTAYTLRHSVITDLVHGGLDLLTVAQISGTSVAMIEKFYGHLRGEVAAEALAKLVL